MKCQTFGCPLVAIKVCKGIWGLKYVCFQCQYSEKEPIVSMLGVVPRHA